MQYPNDAADVLDKVHERLNLLGWCQKRSGPIGGPNCLLGAMSWTLLSFDLSDRLLLWTEEEWQAELATTARELFPERMDGQRNIVHFNDDPNTTWTDIEQVIEKTAIRIRETV